MSAPEREETPRGRAEFTGTCWSVVLLAGQTHSPAAAAALEKLCAAYWYPLYAFVRRQGHSEPEAQDLTQGFLARLLAKRELRAADPAKGKFRCFLLAALKAYLANEWDRGQAQKRGGGSAHFSLDAQEAETRYQLEPVHWESPDRLFERRWAQTALEESLARVQEEYQRDGKGERFALLKPLLTGDAAMGSYEEIGTALGMTEQGIKSAVHRLRQRFRETVREAIAETVQTPAEVDEEMRHLLAAVRG